MEFSGVFYADPDPGLAQALTITAEVDVGLIARDAGKFVGAPVDILKAENIHIEVKSCRHIFYAQDWRASFEMNCVIVVCHIGLSRDHTARVGYLQRRPSHNFLHALERSHDVSQASVCTSPLSTAGKSRTIGFQLSPASDDAYT